MDFPILTFAVIIIALIVMAPFIMKIISSFKGSVAPALGNVSGGGQQAATEFTHVLDTGGDMLDKAMIAVFFMLLLLMLVSSFLIDTSPFWVILYILVVFFIVLFVPNIMDALGAAVYDSPTFATESAGLSFMNSLRMHFGEFLVGIAVLSGIIIYGKVRLFSSGGSGGGRV
ncbi:MAG: hypothetical protein QME12_06630 [Nanoarchaeota archaeon]|nr:hypothetical protein [Nanoarchaeota archaeon]